MPPHSVTPSREEFRELAKRGNLVPVIVDLVADVETPISAFAKIDNGQPCFLFESAEKNEESGRFSFIGFDPLLLFESKDSDPLTELQKQMAQFRLAASGDLGHFIGGAVGFLGYNAIRFFESTVPIHGRDDLELPDAMFMIARSLLVFDHRFRQLRLITLAKLDQNISPDQAYEQARETIGKTVDRLSRATVLPPIHAQKIETRLEPRSNTTQAEFESMVAQAKELISAGDIFQVVLSQRFETDFDGDAFALYRALRFGNPSPYMFCLRLRNDFTLIGSSPEVHLRVHDRVAEIRPIAGTRARGQDVASDIDLARELMADPKERAEHVMLIDLGRNDLGRVSEFGSVKVTEHMSIERYSHVMHIVSHVIGKLRTGQNAFDAVRATFPAGTVSGAPKIRAMQIIADLEKARRGFYSGIVGYFGFDGSHDSCIAIRSIVLKNNKAYLQTGAGIVADSDPAKEYEECVNKAKAMLEAIERAKNL